MPLITLTAGNDIFTGGAPGDTILGLDGSDTSQLLLGVSYLQVTKGTIPSSPSLLAIPFSGVKVMTPSKVVPIASYTEIRARTAW